MRETFQCPLCLREGGFLTPSKHHLVPKSRDGCVTVEICSHCHKQIHTLFTLRELEREYNTLEKLRADERIQRWVRWAGKQGGGRVAFRAGRARQDRNKLKEITYGAA